MMKIPLSTYRLQFNSLFRFSDAKAIIEYLSEIGISDVYASPIFKARKNSHHGYDVVEPNQINPELGSAAEFEDLIREVKQHGMGWLQDVVPNHMAYDGENQMLMNVLEQGRASEYFDFFDIEWNHPYESLRGRLLAPFLGAFYGEALENGEIQLKYDEHGLTVNYYGLRLPLRIASYAQVLTHELSALKQRLGPDHPDFVKLLGILYILKNLNAVEEAQDLYDQIKFVKRILWELYAKNREIRRFVDERIEMFNGTKGNPDSFNHLDGLLSEQLFRLSFWRVAMREVNYRRFFSINDLISLRMEDANVFDRTHALIFHLVGEGKLSGLRIDHVDGLYDPAKYMQRLTERAGDVYLFVEKILDLEEDLPSSWPVQGTTGYDFLNYVNGLFCDGRHERAFDDIYVSFSRFDTPYEDLWYKKKKLIIERQMTGDINNLAHLLKRTLSLDRYGRDITLYALRTAIIEVMALFPVYRTYTSYVAFTDTDRSYIKESIRRAMQRHPSLLQELKFIEGVLLLKFPDYFTEEDRMEWVHFVMRFQQFTGPLTAKGSEDTTLYIYNRLLSLNEVGGRPERFGIGLEKFHAFNEKRAGQWPYSLSATSTHDTKRGEDVRARINVLSEIPQAWERQLKLWHKLNRGRKPSVASSAVPDRNDEYFLYQTLLGAFPFDDDVDPDFVERIKAYVVKAVREAKAHSTWAKPNKEYESAFLSFIDAIMSPSDENQFLREFLPFQRRIAYYGIFNSLGQTLIKLTSPGVPDFYQGTELWDLNLVDPDNRRPVDFEKRKRFLCQLKGQEGNILELIRELLAAKADGRIKLFLIWQGLRARRQYLSVFQKGAYIPIAVEGKFKDHIVAFARRAQSVWALSLAPRFLTGLITEGQYPLGEKVWQDTRLILPEDAPYVWNNALTSQNTTGRNILPVGKILNHFPVALLFST
jgi:(1->4)-alpha-D-glucan 1-alpha-D-glucosylmutase